MIITVAKSAGFCFGVKRAIKIALEAAATGKQVEMLGDIVHNEEVVQQIETAGIKKVDVLTAGKNKTLLIRAHGAAKKTVQEAQNKGYTIIDATCPMVKEIHTIAQDREAKGDIIIVIGDKGHDEVQGIIGQLQSPAIVIDNPENIPTAALSGIHHATVVVQSTQAIENVRKILDVLEKKIPNVRFHNTICKATQTRQQEIKTLPGENDVVLVIGSKTSANTKRLYEISKQLNQNTYWILSKDDILPEWFKNVKKVGITAGASTPNESIEGVVNWLHTQFP